MNKQMRKLLDLSLIIIPIILIISVPLSLHFLLGKSNYEVAQAYQKVDKFDEAASYYGKTFFYGETSSRLDEMNARILEIQTENTYKSALDFYKAKEYAKAITGFENIPDYKDAKSYIKKAKDAKAKQDKADAAKKKKTAESEKWKQKEYWVNAYDDFDICVRSSAKMDGECNSSLEGNVIDYINKGSGTRLYNEKERKKDGEGKWWYKVSIGSESGRVGWVREDVIK